MYSCQHNYTRLKLVLKFNLLVRYRCNIFSRSIYCIGDTCANVLYTYFRNC